MIERPDICCWRPLPWRVGARWSAVVSPLLAGVIGLGSAAVMAAGWDAQALPPLAGSAATGARFAPLQGDVVEMAANGVATSTEPTLQVTADANGRRVRCQILTADDRGVLLWQSPEVAIANQTARCAVPPGVLRPQATYQMAAVDAANPRNYVVAPRPLHVDPQRAGAQQIHAFAGMNVTEVTGEPVVSIASHGVATLAGPAGFTLTHRPTQAAEPGLPPGWSINPAGAAARWKTLTLAPGGGLATLAQADGFTVSYARTTGEAYIPRLGPHHTWSGGAYADLYRNADGTYTVIDVNQGVTTFPAQGARDVTGAEILHPKRAWTDGSTLLQQGFDANGRLQKLTDPVSQRKILFHYAGAGACGAPRSGFIAPPAGKLCAVTDWSGAKTTLGYVRTAAGPQIGRITAFAGAGQDAEVSDLGWDASGRIIALRQPLAAAAIAARAIEGLEAGDVRAQTTIEYDDRGRVLRVTAPAPLVPAATQTPAQNTRTTQTYRYQLRGSDMVFTAEQTGIAMPFVEQSTATLATMDRTRIIGPDGCGTETRFNDDDNATGRISLCDQTRTQTTYDAQGQPYQTFGPSRLPMTTTSGAPVSTTRYDTTHAEGQPVDQPGRPLTGLAFFAFDNARQLGTPALRSIGPIINGQTASVMILGWSSNPSGHGTAWSGRLSGFFTAPRRDDYRFSANTGVRLTVDGQSCTAATPCRITLEAGASAELQVAFAAPTGAASVILQVARGAGPAQPIPASELFPGLHEATEQELVDELAPGEPPQRIRELNRYDNEHGGQLVEMRTSENRTVRYRWHPNTGQNGLYGQMASWTGPGGRTTYDTYYKGTQTATGCTGAARQGGLLKSTLTEPLPGTTQIYNRAGQATTASGGGTDVCIHYDAAGQMSNGEAIGSGAPFALARDARVGGNPLVASVTETAQGQVTTATRRLSLTGQVYQSTDSYGTTITHAYDPSTGSPTEITERTAAGETRTRRFSYDTFGRPTTLTVNDRVIETISYGPDGSPDIVRYANGTSARTELDANNNITELTYDGFAGGIRLGETRRLSRGGAVLTRTLRGADGTASFAYVYSPDHRLIRSTVSGSLPGVARDTRLDFAGPSGANGNRQSATTTAGGVTTTATYSYTDADRLTATTEPGLAPIDYDPQGRTTRLGEATLSYDAGGNLTDVSAPRGVFVFAGNGNLEYTPTGQPTITLRTSGDLLLDDTGRIIGQWLSLAHGVSVLLDPAGTPTLWQYPDLQGSIAWQTGGNAAPEATTVYDPWGLKIAGATAPVPMTPLDLALQLSAGWSGTLPLPNTDLLVVMGAREYAPAAGRFLQLDPLEGGGLNPYEYADSDPLNNSDPEGLLSRGTWAGMAIGLALGAAIILTAATKGAFAGPTAALWKAMMAGGAAGLTSGAASYTSQHFIDGGTTADYDWKQAGIRMGVGAGVGMVSGGVGFAKAKAGVTAAQAKLNAANSKWDSLSNNVEILQKTNDAALHKATVLLNQQDKVVTTATRELKSAKATYDVANALKSGLLTKLAIAGMAIVPTGAAAGAGIAYEMLTNPAASTGGDDTPQDDPGSNDQGSYRASSAAGVMLRQLLQGD